MLLIPNLLLVPLAVYFGCSSSPKSKKKRQDHQLVVLWFPAECQKILFFPLSCLSPPMISLYFKWLGRLRSWAALIQKEDFVYQHLLSVLSSSVFPSALFCSGGTHWTSSSAVSLSALQAGFHSLRSYCLSLFFSFPPWLSASFPLIFSLHPSFFFSFTSFFLQIFLQGAFSSLCFCSIISPLVCFMYTLNFKRTVEKSLSLVCSLMLVSVLR